MIHRRRTLAGGMLAAALVIGACGGDDDEPAATDAPSDTDEEAADDPVATDADESSGDESDDAAPPATEAPEAETDSDTDEQSDSDSDDDPIVIDDFGDIPGECIDLLGDFLREIEPDVGAVDWQTATLADLEPLDELIAEPSDEFDRAATELGCDEFDFGIDDEQSLDFVIRVAQQEAPGTVSWLQFIADLSAFADDITDDPTDPDAEPSAPPSADADLPTDCEGTKQYLLSAAEQYGSIDAIPVAEAMTLTTAITNVTTLCGFDDAIAFLEDPTIQAFLDS